MGKILRFIYSFVLYCVFWLQPHKDFWVQAILTLPYPLLGAGHPPGHGHFCLVLAIRPLPSVLKSSG